MIDAFKTADRTPMMATFWRIPIYFFKIKNRFNNIAPTDIPILTKFPKNMLKFTFFCVFLIDPAPVWHVKAEIERILQ